MRYPYIVCIKGNWIPAGTDIPEDKPSPVKAEVKEEPIEVPSSAEVVYTRTEINRMNVDTLRKLAKESNIEGADELSGTKLKSALIEYFEL